MSSVRLVSIDFNEAGLDFDRAEMEAFLIDISEEMQADELVQEARLARETDIPDSAKSGAAAFFMGILTAEINGDSLGKVINYLGNLRYGKTLVLSGDIDGMPYSIEYRSKEELDQAADTIERLVNLRIRMLEGQKTRDLGE